MVDLIKQAAANLQEARREAQALGLAPELDMRFPRALRTCAELLAWQGGLQALADVQGENHFSFKPPPVGKSTSQSGCAVAEVFPDPYEKAYQDVLNWVKQIEQRTQRLEALHMGGNNRKG